VLGTLVLILLWAQDGKPPVAVPVLVKDTGADKFLLASQFFLAGSGVGSVVTHASWKFQENAGHPATSVSLIGLSIGAELALQKKWSSKKKIWVGVANIAAGAILAGYLRSNISHIKSGLQQAQ
jgi:uncharacterized protein YfiM (DUF2279 family)